MSSKAWEIAIIALIVVNGFELAVFLGLHRRSGLYPLADQFPLPSGYLSSGYMYTNTYQPPQAAPCYLIRLSSRACPYCRLDQDQYGLLLRQAARAGCQTILMAPVALAAESLGDSRTVQLQYIDMKFGRTLNPFLTPQTILLDSHARAIWSRGGAMDNRSVAQAIGALDALRK